MWVALVARQGAQEMRLHCRKIRMGHDVGLRAGGDDGNRDPEDVTGNFSDETGWRRERCFPAASQLTKSSIEVE
jgi:hypothetical protein